MKTYTVNNEVALLAQLTDGAYTPSATNAVASKQLATFDQLFGRIDDHGNGAYTLYPVAMPGDTDTSPIEIDATRMLHLIGVTMPLALRQQHLRQGGVNKYFPAAATGSVVKKAVAVATSPLAVLKASILGAIRDKLALVDDDRIVESLATQAGGGSLQIVTDVDTSNYVTAINIEANKIHIQRARGLFVHQDEGRDNRVNPTDSEAIACGISASKSLDVYQLDINVVSTDLIVSYIPESDDVTNLLLHKLTTYYKKANSKLEGRKDVITISLKPANCKQ